MRVLHEDVRLGSGSGAARNLNASFTQCGPSRGCSFRLRKCRQWADLQREIDSLWAHCSSSVLRQYRMSVTFSNASSFVASYKLQATHMTKRLFSTLQEERSVPTFP